MKKNHVSTLAIDPKTRIGAGAKGNGNSVLAAESGSADLAMILASLHAVRDGDFSVRLPGDWTGLPGKVADAFNEIVSANQQMAHELKRIGEAVGKQGRTKERARIHESRGAWGEMERSINTLVEDLLRPTGEVTHAIAAVAQGNLTQTVRLEVDGRPLEGEFLRSAKLVNTMNVVSAPLRAMLLRRRRSALCVMARNDGIAANGSTRKKMELKASSEKRTIGAVLISVNACVAGFTSMKQP